MVFQPVDHGNAIGQREQRTNTVYSAKRRDRRDRKEKNILATRIHPRNWENQEREHPDVRRVLRNLESE